MHIAGMAILSSDKYPLGKCHACGSGSGPVKIAAAIAIAAAGLGGGIATRNSGVFLRERKLHPTPAKQPKAATKKQRQIQTTCEKKTQRLTNR